MTLLTYLLKGPKSLYLVTLLAFNPMGMGVGAGLYMCDVVKKFTFAISSPDESLVSK